jgi:hypothetical protein
MCPRLPRQDVWEGDSDRQQDEGRVPMYRVRASDTGVVLRTVPEKDLSALQGRTENQIRLVCFWRGWEVVSE